MWTGETVGWRGIRDWELGGRGRKEEAGKGEGGEGKPTDLPGDAKERHPGLAGRTNTVLQACFFALTDLMETTEAVAAIKQSIQITYIHIYK